MKKKDKSSDPFQADRKRNDALNKSDHKNENSPLPGDYAASEDIMNRRDQQRVGMDVENFARAAGYEIADNVHEPIITRPVGSNLDSELAGDPILGSVDDAEQPRVANMERPIPKDFVDDDILDRETPSESDVTEEDLQALGPKDLSLDMGEDEQLLKNRVYPVDMTGGDLDIPMAEGADDDLDEAIGPEDEENDFYSLGGDRLEDNMEGK